MVSSHVSRFILRCYFRCGKVRLHSLVIRRAARISSPRVGLIHSCPIYHASRLPIRTNLDELFLVTCVVALTVLEAAA